LRSSIGELEDEVELDDKAEEMGVENMFPIPREKRRTPKSVVDKLGSLRVKGLVKPVHELDHPPAKIPYAIPKDSRPARLYERTPQRMKVTAEVNASVEKAKNQGFILSERYPIDSRPNTAPPFNDAKAIEEVVLLKLKSLANVGSQTIGTKYPNPWNVLATTNIQNGKFLIQSLFSRPRGVGPTLVRLRETGKRPLIKRRTGTMRTTIAMDRIRKVLEGPYAESKGGKMRGRRIPPTEVPAETTPLANPRLWMNHSDK